VNSTFASRSVLQRYRFKQKLSSGYW